MNVFKDPTKRMLTEKEMRSAERGTRYREYRNSLTSLSHKNMKITDYFHSLFPPNDDIGSALSTIATEFEGNENILPTDALSVMVEGVVNRPPHLLLEDSIQLLRQALTLAAPAQIGHFIPNEPYPQDELIHLAEQFHEEIIGLPLGVFNPIGKIIIII